ncbi:MAG: DUF1801 domain-containing protein [Ilumatobacteraceae bacterium]
MTTDQDSTGEVKLLAGGNPQIPKGDGDAPVRAYLAAMPDWKGEIGRRIDELVNEAVPDARKAVRWNSPFYGIDGSGWFLSLHCFTKYVKVTWLNGAQLDPLPPVTSKDERVRYSNIAAVDEIDDDQFRDWIHQAARAPGDPLF